METLSDKEIKCKHNEMVFEKKDVKESIKELREKLILNHCSGEKKCEECKKEEKIIEKVFGKDLTE